MGLTNSANLTQLAVRFAAAEMARLAPALGSEAAGWGGLVAGADAFKDHAPEHLQIPEAGDRIQDLDTG
jgi:hypothetical protein